MTPEEAIKILQLNKGRMNGSVQSALDVLLPELESHYNPMQGDPVVRALGKIVGEALNKGFITLGELRDGADELRKVVRSEVAYSKPMRHEISYQPLTAREKELLEGKQVEGPKNCRNCRNEKHCFREDTHWGGPCEDYERKEAKK